MIKYIKLFVFLESFREVIDKIKHEYCGTNMKSISKNILYLLGFKILGFIL